MRKLRTKRIEQACERFLNKTTFTLQTHVCLTEIEHQLACVYLKCIVINSIQQRIVTLIMAASTHLIMARQHCHEYLQTEHMKRARQKARYKIELN